jgi:hypothetical protein
LVVWALDEHESGVVGVDCFCCVGRVAWIGRVERGVAGVAAVLWTGVIVILDPPAINMFDSKIFFFVFSIRE